MIDVESLRRRIGQEFEGECHLTADEARRVFDVYEAACTWRGARDAALWTRDQTDDRLIVAVDAARSIPLAPGALMSEVSTQEESDQRAQEAWATVPADLERLAEQCCDEYHGEIGTFQNFADDRQRWREFAKFLWGLGARPHNEGHGR